ncbi:ATP-dependent DNA ligase [Mariniluteicoccus endophyticus]
MDLPVMPPLKPMLAKPAAKLPPGWRYEPKWDGFRTIIFRDGDEVMLGSRNEKPLTRYFPEVVDQVLAQLPQRCVVDGEIVCIDATGRELDFEALGQRIHPAESRVRMLAEASPASFIAFDLLALGDDDLMSEPFDVRRARLEEGLAEVRAPVHLTPLTSDEEAAARWFADFEGAGLDGLIAKDPGLAYQPDKRVMTKIKHVRTTDCVVAGYRVHKSGPGRVGSLMLGLHDDEGNLRPVGVIGAFTARRREELFTELQPLVTDFAGHPWAWAEGAGTAAQSRWSAGKDASFVPLSPELVVEVRYDFMEGDRFRHTAQFVRWRPDRDPASCTLAQLERPAPYAIADVLAAP